MIREVYFTPRILVPQDVKVFAAYTLTSGGGGLFYSAYTRTSGGGARGGICHSGYTRTSGGGGLICSAYTRT